MFLIGSKLVDIYQSKVSDNIADSSEFCGGFVFEVVHLGNGFGDSEEFFLTIIDALKFFL